MSLIVSSHKTQLLQFKRTISRSEGVSIVLRGNNVTDIVEIESRNLQYRGCGGTSRGRVQVILQMVLLLVSDTSGDYETGVYTLRMTGEERDVTNLLR